MDNEIFLQIYQEYAKPLFKFLFNLSGNYDIAEDLTQETFTKAYQNLDNFRGECRLYVWLCQIGKNLYFNYLKKNRRCDGTPDMYRIASTHNVEEQILDRTTALEIMEALSFLQEPYQTVFVCRIFSELSYKEIGDSFHKSDTWARVTYYRAKTMLQQKMKEEKHYEM